MDKRSIITGKSPEQIIGIFASDIHLTERAPVARSAEPDWLAAQLRPISQLADLQAKYGCPILVAGDLFNRWDAPAWLVSWFLHNASRGRWYAVPGQHDLPGHNLDLIKKSAFWTLVEAGRIHYIPPGSTYDIQSMFVTGFAWNVPITPPDKTHSFFLNLALIHRYIWTKDTGGPFATEETRWGKQVSKLKGYDVSAWGDNHKGFLVQEQGEPSVTKPKKYCTVMNCGTLQRRNRDEMNYRPRVGLLHASGKITQHFLNCKADKWSDTVTDIEQIEAATGLDLSEFLDELLRLRDYGQDYGSVVKAWAEKNKVKQSVLNVILGIIKKVKK